MTEPLKVVELPRRDPTQAIVSHLEDLLEEARAGKIHAIAYVISNDEGLSSAYPGKWESMSMLVGQIERMKFDILCRLDLEVSTSKT